MNAAKIADFRPALYGGKWHNPNTITGQATCRGTLLLDLVGAPIRVSSLNQKNHPVCCKRCITQLKEEA